MRAMQTIEMRRSTRSTASGAVGLIAAALLIGCQTTPTRAPTPAPATASALHGRYAVTATGKQDDFVEPADRTAITAVLARGGHAGDIFAGTDRGDAKTSIAPGANEGHSTIAAVRSTLPTDAHMLGLGITKARDSPRTPDEQRNVTVGAVIYAISKESDNDFHLIAGDPNCRDGSCRMNVEVSGLPPSTSASYSTLKAVRDKFLAFFDGTDPGTSGGYDKFDPPISVTLTGSLFFDVDHKAGVVGPTGLRPDSAWEIHPVTDITFEP